MVQNQEWARNNSTVEGGTVSVIQAAHRFGGGNSPPPALELVALPVGPTGQDPRLIELVKAFAASRNMRTTADSYLADIMGSGAEPRSDQVDRALSYVEFLTERGVDFFTATREDVDAWRNYMDQEKGLAPATRARRLAAVKGVYTYGVTDWGKLPRVLVNPAKDVVIPRTASILQYTGLSLAELGWLLRGVETAAYQRIDKNWRRSAAIVSVLAHTGIRRNELASANISDLMTEREHRILHVIRKGGQPQGIVVPASPGAILDRYLDGRTTGPLIISEDGPRLDGSGIYRAVRRVGDYHLSGLGIRLHPHDLRHSCATLLYELGASDWEVQTTLGHADSRTTQRYNHARLTLDSSPLYMLAGALADSHS